MHLNCNNMIYQFCNKKKIHFVNKPQKDHIINVNPKSVTLRIGEEVQLTASEDVVWVSSNEGFATVNQQGVVVGLAEGVVEVTAISKSDVNIFDACVVAILGENENTDNVNYSTTAYISHYVRDNTITEGEDYILEYYVSDVKQSEYMLQQDTMIKASIKVDGIEVLDDLVRCGDNIVNLGSFEVGEHEVVMTCGEGYSTSSSSIFKFRVIDNTYDSNITSHTYVMTQDDLLAYNINNQGDSSYSILNIEGINQLLLDKHVEGYLKIIMLSGIYILDISQTISIPSNFTLDLNSSTFKLLYSLEDYGLMVKMQDCFDSHLVNGILEGDFQDRVSQGTLTTTPKKGEFVYAFEYIGNCNYCSVRNLTIQKTTGYAMLTRSDCQTYDVLKMHWFENGKDIIDGTIVDDISKTSMTRKFDLAKYKENGYLSVNKFLGYQGFVSNDSIIRVHYYSFNEEFIKTENVRQYRNVKIPKNAHFITLTLSLPQIEDIHMFDDNSQLYITLFATPTNCSFENIQGIDTRTCVFAPTACKDLIIHGCDFTRCGTSITPGPTDFEDGWEMMQDIRYSNNNTIAKAPGQSFDLIVCAGQNIIIENNRVTDIRIRERVLGGVIRNNPSLTYVDIGQTRPLYSIFTRCYNNTMDSYQNNYMIQTQNYSVYQVLVNNQINVVSGAMASPENIKLINCTITKQLYGGHALNSSFEGTDIAIRSVFLKDCIIKYSTIKCYGINMDGGEISNSTLLTVGVSENAWSFQNVHWFNSEVKSHAYMTGGKNLLIANCIVDNINLTPFNFYMKDSSPVIRNSTFNLGSANLFNFIHPARPSGQHNEMMLSNNIINTNASVLINANLGYVEASDTGTYIIRDIGNTISNQNCVTMAIPTNVQDKIFIVSNK